MKTLKVRVKDKHSKYLEELAGNVNFVWNYINEISSKSIQQRAVFMSSYDIQKYTVGSHKELKLHSHTVQKIGSEYVTRRRSCKKNRLAWRKTKGSRKSLGWIPFNTGAVKWRGGKLHYNKICFGVWDSYGLSNYELRSGSFNQDARGRWYLNIVVKPEMTKSTGGCVIGIDLGVKNIASCSDGSLLSRDPNAEILQVALRNAQRSNNKQRVRSIHAKIKNRKLDRFHKFSSGLVKRSKAIFVGNVSTNDFTKTSMAGLIYSSSWYTLKTMLEYKCDHAGIVFKEVNEAYTTQTCSCCGWISDNSPKGRAGLGIREWTCSECGVTHDRDLNAAKNILAVGHGRPVEGTNKRCQK